MLCIRLERSQSPGLISVHNRMTCCIVRDDIHPNPEAPKRGRSVVMRSNYLKGVKKEQWAGS